MTSATSRTFRAPIEVTFKKLRTQRLNRSQFAKPINRAVIRTMVSCKYTGRKCKESSGNGQSPAPTKVMKLNEVKPASEKIAGNRQEQPRTVNPPAKIQPQPAPDVHSSESTVTEQQPRTVNPPPKSQPSQPRSVSPSVNKRMAQQPRTVNPPPKSQPSQPRTVSPSVNNRNAQQPGMVKPPAKSQPPTASECCSTQKDC